MLEFIKDKQYNHENMRYVAPLVFSVRVTQRIPPQEFSYFLSMDALIVPPSEYAIQFIPLQVSFRSTVL